MYFSGIFLGGCVNLYFPKVALSHGGGGGLRCAMPVMLSAMIVNGWKVLVTIVQ